jgi:hypothetical protein
MCLQKRPPAQKNLSWCSTRAGGIGVSNSQSTKMLIRHVPSLSIAGMALIKQTHNSVCVLRFVRPSVPRTTICGFMQPSFPMRTTPHPLRQPLPLRWRRTHELHSRDLLPHDLNRSASSATSARSLCTTSTSLDSAPSHTSKTTDSLSSCNSQLPPPMAETPRPTSSLLSTCRRLGAHPCAPLISHRAPLSSAAAPAPLRGPLPLRHTHASQEIGVASSPCWSLGKRPPVPSARHR